MMDTMSGSIGAVWQVLPLLALVIFAIFIIWGVNHFIFGRLGLLAENRLLRQLTILALVALSIVALILALPVGEETKGHLFSLVGLLLTAVIAMSSTTVASNAMAGLMLRAMHSFHTGDFVRVGNHFGRVTGIGLFHTEIQTSNRDLTALPNNYIANNPATVVRRSGTVIEATLSIGYDVPHGKVEELLLKAAEQTGLEDAFVLILELGNFAVTYRIAGFLGETRRLVSAGTVLRREVLDTLHRAGIEIASPNLMSQRPLDPAERLVPHAPVGTPSRQAGPLPEEIVFDKAEEAERIEQLRLDRKELAQQLKELEGRRDRGEASEREMLEAEIAARQQQLEDIDRFLGGPE